MENPIENKEMGTIKAPENHPHVNTPGIGSFAQEVPVDPKDVPSSPYKYTPSAKTKGGIHDPNSLSDKEVKYIKNVIVNSTHAADRTKLDHMRSVEKREAEIMRKIHDLKEKRPLPPEQKKELEDLYFDLNKIKEDNMKRRVRTQLTPEQRMSLNDSMAQAKNDRKSAIKNAGEFVKERTELMQDDEKLSVDIDKIEESLKLVEGKSGAEKRAATELLSSLRKEKRELENILTGYKPEKDLARGELLLEKLLVAVGLEKEAADALKKAREKTGEASQEKLPHARDEEARAGATFAAAKTEANRLAEEARLFASAKSEKPSADDSVNIHTEEDAETIARKKREARLAKANDVIQKEMNIEAAGQNSSHSQPEANPGGKGINLEKQHVETQGRVSTVIKDSPGNEGPLRVAYDAAKERMMVNKAEGSSKEVPAQDKWTSLEKFDVSKEKKGDTFDNDLSEVAVLKKTESDEERKERILGAIYKNHNVDLPERAKRANMSEKMLDILRAGAETYKALPLKTKVAVSLTLFGIAATAGGTVASLAVGGSVIQRILGGAATFIAAEGALKAAAEKGGRERSDFAKSRHTVEALVAGFIVGGGAIGHAIQNFLDASITPTEKAASSVNQPTTHTEAAAQPAHHAEIAPKAVSHIETAKAGDSIWKMTQHQLEAQYGEKFTGLSDEKQTYLIDAIKDRIAKNPGDFGMTNANNIEVGQTVNFEKILSDKGFMDAQFNGAENEPTVETTPVHPDAAKIAELKADILKEATPGRVVGAEEFIQGTDTKEFSVTKPPAGNITDFIKEGFPATMEGVAPEGAYEASANTIPQEIVPNKFMEGAQSHVNKLIKEVLGKKGFLGIGSTSGYELFNNFADKPVNDIVNMNPQTDTERAVKYLVSEASKQTGVKPTGSVKDYLLDATATNFAKLSK